jgi:predicted MFS family arabinose efflux permease
MEATRGLREFFGLKRNLVLMLIAIVAIGAGEETWMRFVPKYLESLGAAAFVIGLYDGLKTLLGAVYAYPGGAVVDRWGHRKGLVAFTGISIAGYLLVLVVPRWPAVIGATFLFLAWSALSLPAMFSLVAANLASAKHTMGIGVQSLIKRLPIVIGPLAGGMLIDRYGIVSGVRAGLAISIVLGLAAIWVQRQIQDDPFGFEHASTNFLAVVRSFDPPLRRLLFSDILVRFCERIPYAWVVIYAMDDVGISATKVGVLAAIEVIVASACYVPVAALAERYGREPFVIATFFFFTIFPLSLVFAHSFALLVVAFVIRGLKEFGDSPRKALIVGYARPEMRGRTVGAYYLIRDTFVSLGSLLGAWLWHFGPSANFWGATALGVAGTAVYCATMPSRRRELR